MRPTTCSSSIILPRKPQQKECGIQKKRRVLLPATVTLCVNQIVINADNKKQQAFRRTHAAFKYFRIIQHIMSQKTHYSYSQISNVFIVLFILFLNIFVYVLFIFYIFYLVMRILSTKLVPGDINLHLSSVEWF